MHRAPIPSTLSRQQMAPAASLGTAYVNADATAAAQSSAASGMHSPFQSEQLADLPAEPSAARPISGRLFPDTAKGHMAMVCRFSCNIHMLLLLASLLVMCKHSMVASFDMLHRAWS